MRYVIDDILYALAAEIGGDRSWFDLTGPEKTNEILEEAMFLAKHDPVGYVDREFYKRKEPEFKKAHAVFEDTILKLALNNPKGFFDLDIWRKPTAVRAFGENAEQKLQYLINGATRNLIRQDPVAALMKYKIHHYQPFKYYYKALLEALTLKYDPNTLGFKPEDKDVNREFERLKKVINQK
jgi:hypothetical protein